MAKAKKPADEDIIPPTQAMDDENVSSAEAGRAAGASLRMPPLIDHHQNRFRAWLTDLRDRLVGAGWRGHLIDMTTGLQAGSLHIVKRTAYHMVLWTLVGATIIITGYGIWQARNVELPQFDNFWFNPERVLQDRLQRQSQDQENLMPIDDLRARLSAASNDDNQQADTEGLQTPSPEAAVKTLEDPALLTSSELAGQKPDSQTADQTATARLSKLQKALEAEQETKAQLSAALAEAEQKLNAARAAASQQADNLAARYAMADLLLRLESGLAYEDILTAGHLQPVLSRRELALLALHGGLGIPTEAGLGLQYQAWLEALDEQTVAGPYARLMDWLIAHASGLVRVTPTPLALADQTVTAIADDLAAGRLDMASLALGRLLRGVQDAGSLSSAQIAALQTVYDDTRAAAELAPLVATLKRDYIAGVRP